MTNKAEKIKEEMRQISAIFGLFKQDANSMSKKGKEVKRKREGERREKLRENREKADEKRGKRSGKKERKMKFYEK